MMSVLQPRRAALKLLSGAVASTALLGAPSILRAQEVRELRVSLFLPENHPWVQDWLEPWGNVVRERTGGAVSLRFHGAGSAFGQAPRQYDQVAAGVVDISAGMRGFPAGRLWLTSLIESPYMVRHAGAASRALWDLFPEYLAQEYEGVKVLALHAQNAGPFHMAGKEIHETADFRSLRLRSPNSMVNRLLEFYGAVPVGLPAAEIYEGFNRGTVDGAVMPWNGVWAYSLADLLTYHLDAGASTSAFYLAMNPRTYDGLPQDIRTVIDETTGAAFLDRWQGWWDGWDAPGIEAATASGNVIVTLPDDERAQWKAEARPVIDDVIAEVEAAGYPQARAVHEAMAERVAEYESGSGL